MIIQVQDILLDPLNRPIPNATIEIVSLVNGEEVLLCARASTASDATGNVSFELVKGDYRIYLQQAIQYPKVPIGYINSIVFGSVASPATLTSLITETL